jgi:hypothetical protein
MRLSGVKWIAIFFLAAILSAPAWGATPALPGTLNYVEGQASIGNEALNSKSVGSVDLVAGQTLTTGAGKAEVLMTPGVFFRLGDDSAATLVSPSLTNTEIALVKGQAMVEVDDIHKDNLLRVQENGAETQLLKAGIYGFDAAKGDVRVFKGEALVQDGDRQVKVKAGHELALVNENANASFKTAKFDEREYQQSDLYRFSNLRSQYLAGANIDAASLYWPGGPGWFGAGWYWDPGFYGYTWLPGNGIFMSPFGWGFYSPLWVGYAPYYGYGRYPWRGYGYGPTGQRPYVTGRSAYTPPAHFSGYRGPANAGVSAPHFGVMGGGFRGGGFSGGGFHR